LVGWLIDVSLSGAYIKTTAAFAVMSQISIEVDERHGGNTGIRPISLQGCVVRHGATGLGIEWEEYGLGMLAELVRISTCIPARRIGWTRAGPQYFEPLSLAMSGDSNQTLHATEP